MDTSLLTNSTAVSNVAKLSSSAGQATATGTAASPSQHESASASSAAELHEALTSIRQSMQSTHRNLEFSLDSDSGLTVVKVIDQSSGEMIRQIPSEVAVKLAASLKESGSLLLSERA